MTQWELVRSGLCPLLVVMPLLCLADDNVTVRTITQLGGSVTRRGNDPQAPVIGVKLGTSDWQFVGELERNLMRSGQHIFSPRTEWGVLAAFTELECLDLSGDQRHRKQLTLSPHLPTFSGLRKLNLDYSYVNVDELARLLQNAPQLQSLSLIDVEYAQNNSKVFPPEGGIDMSVLRHCPNLRELTLDVLPDFHSLKCATSLERLRLVDMYLSDVHPQYSPEWPKWKENWLLLKDLPKLTTIDMPPSVAALVALQEAGILHKFGGATTIDGQRPKSAEDVVLFNLFNSPSSHRGPPVPGINLVDNEVLKALTNFPRLQSLDLSESLVTDDGLVALQSWPHLRQITIRYGLMRRLQDEAYRRSPAPPAEARLYQRISDAGIARIMAIPTLKALNLTGCSVSDQTLALIRQRPELEELVLQLETITDADLQHLAALTNLRTLELDGKRGFTDANFQALESLKHLEELDLSTLNLSDQNWSVVQHFPHLRHLRISSSSATRLGLSQLNGLKDLSTLEIVHSYPTQGINPEALSLLRDCRGLTRLWLDQQLITDGVLKAVRECGHLRALSTEPTYGSELPTWVPDHESPPTNVPARTLNFSRVEVTDAGIAELASLRDLEELTLYASGVQGPGLKSLAALPRLKSLNINVSDDVLETLSGIDRLHLLPCTFGRDGGRPVDASDIVRFDIPAVQQVIHSPITARGLAALKPLERLHTLRYFSFEHQLNDEQVMALSDIGLLQALPQAKAADGGRPTGLDEVITLNLEGSRLTEAVFPAILQFTNLRELRMTVPRTTNLIPLAALKRLEILYATDQGNPPRGIVELKKLRPDLSIRF